MLSDPERVMVLAAGQARSDLVEIADDRGAENLRHRPAFHATGLGVFGKEQQLDVIGADALDMAVEGERGEAAAADRPEAQDRDDQPVAELDLALHCAAGRKAGGLLHQGHAELERLMSWYQSLEAVLGLSAHQQPALQRLKPAPVTIGRDEAGGVVKLGDGHSDRGGVHGDRVGIRGRGQVLDISADPHRRDAVGRGELEVPRMRGSQEAKPAPPAEADGSARALREVGTRTEVVIEDVARR